MQHCLSSHLSRGCRRLESALAQNLKQDCDESSLSPKQHPCVWIRSISSQNRAQAPSVPPLQGFPRCKEGGAKVALGYTQALLFVETMLMCHPSVLVSHSLKHSNMTTVLICCELVLLSDEDESSPALTAATFKPLNSALKLATQ